MHPDHDDHIEDLRALVRTLEHAGRQTDALLTLPAGELPDRRGDGELRDQPLQSLRWTLSVHSMLIGGILPPA